jgi:two-component system sensor histidine kinase BaeS
MKVRNKLVLAFGALIVFMGSVFFSIAHGYIGNLFRQYANAAEQANAEQWAHSLEWFYLQNGLSWDGVSQYIFGILQERPGRNLGFDHLILYDENHHAMVQVGTPSDTASGQHMTEVPITVAGQVVGAVAISDRVARGSPVEQNVLHSMTIAAVWGTIITSLLALIVGAWLARIFTNPLRSMIATMRRIQDGDLQARIHIKSKDEFGEVAATFNEMTDRLWRTEEARRHLVADVAHELRTPLTIMQGQLELIQQGVKPAEPATLLPIQDEVMRLTRLVQDLHQLSLAEVGNLPLNKAPTDVVELVERVVDNFQIEAEERQIQLLFESAVEHTAILQIDPDRMTQVFVNLLGNALRYTPSGGRVVVRVERADKDIRVSVADSGPGIDEAHLPHIFNRFYRVEGDRSRGSGGTGLGLAIAKEFVEAHHGRIDVSSVVGRGTVFDVWLPLSSS